MLKILGTDKNKVILDKEILNEDNRITKFGACMIAAELAFDITVAVLISRMILKRNVKL